jgi:hypothetical protein
MEFLTWIEQTGFATFVRESPSYLAFPTFLFLHTLGLSLVVGPSVIVAVRVLGLVRVLPIEPLARLFPFMWAGFAITVFSGVGLAVADATNKLLNPILLTKLVLIGFATWAMWLLQKRTFRTGVTPDESTVAAGRFLAGSTLVLWFAVTVAGRLIAYSRTILNI